MLGFLIWNGAIFNLKTNRSLALIEKDQKLATAEKVKLMDELSDDLFQRNSGLFLGTLGLIIGYLIGYNNQNNS